MKIIFIYLFIICSFLTSCNSEIKNSEQCLGEWKMLDNKSFLLKNDDSCEKLFILKENGIAIYNNLTLRDFSVSAKKDIRISEIGTWEIVSYPNSDSDNLLIKLLKNIIRHQYLCFKFTTNIDSNDKKICALLTKGDALKVEFSCSGDPNYYGCTRFQLVSNINKAK